MFLGPVFRRISDFVTSLESRAAASTATADAHASVARALTKQLPIAADPSGALARLSLLTPGDVTLPENGATALGYVRGRPLHGAFDVLAAPAWAHGMAVAQTAGPFVDEHLIPSWIDTIVPVPKQIAIVRGVGGAAIAYLQPSSVTETREQTGTNVTLGPGSIWIPAQLLTTDAPANGFAGIAFSSAMLFVPDGIAPSPSGDVYLIGQGVTVQLDLVPAVAPAPPAGAANDSAGALASLPPNVHIEFAPDGVHVTGLENAAMTAYGANALFADGPGAVAYDPDLAEIAVAYRTVTSPATVTVAASTSPTFTLRGTAPVVRGTYRIPVALTTASALGPAASGGALGLLLGAGMGGRWGGLDAPIGFAETLLHVQTGVLGVVGRTAARPFRDTYELWDARSTPDHPRAATITVSGPRGTLIREGESAAGEIVVASGCRVEASIDRPLLASGSAPSLAGLTAAYTLVHAGADTTLLIEAGPTPPPPSILVPPPPPPVAYVIENAVLRTAGVDALVAYGKLTGQRATQGVLFLGNALDRLIPILPDPYASNIDIHEEIVSEQLIAVTSWTSPPAPHLAFAILRPPQQNAGAAEFAPDVNRMLSRETFAATRGGLDALYDVSSAQNQFGVALSRVALAQGQILGQQLAVSGLQSGLFTVPAIAWEPVLDVGRGWFFPISADDGPPGIVAVPTVTLRPLEPGAFYDAFIADYGKGADLLASLTLPFGLTATVDTRADVNTEPVIARPDLLAIEPKFPGDRKGGKQLSLQGKYDPKYDRTVLPGSSRADSPYVQEILDKPSIAHVIANMWDEDFGGAPVAGAVTTHFVPLSRYNLSGYGASTFSDFQYHGDETGITEARFDVIVGRTVYELVQAQSFILPWNIQVVNTTIFERDATGYVTRHNTGWRAKSDGTFTYKGVPATEIERGGVTGVFNVRNIVEGNPETVDGKTYVRVTFDANVQIVADAPSHGLKVTGGDRSGLLPSRGLTGYLIADAKQKPSIADSVRLLDVLGPVHGPIAAEVDVNGTGIAMGLTGIEVTATRADIIRNPTNPRTIAAAIRGTPRLPRDGSWSVATRPRATTTPQAIDPKIPVPLMRSVADSATWRLADAADVVKFDDPLRFYGILQATGANKVFFEHPTIRNVAGKNPLNFDQTPKLADVGKLLGDNGLLPDILSLLDFGAFDGLGKAADGFSLKQTLKNNVDLGNRTLIPLGPVRVVMASWPDPPGPKPTEITLDLDPTGSPRWRIAIKNIAFKLAVDGWGGDADALITVHGDASAQDGSSPTFANIGVKYGSSLDIVKSILTEVEQFIAFLPGGKASGLDVSFAGSKLRVRENFPIPKLPLGLGYLEDISLSLGFDVDVLQKKLGFFVGLGDDQKPFHWLVSPLSGNGFLQLGASDKMGVKMQAGVGVGLAIDFAIVSGSASIVIAVQFDATSSPIGVMVLLTGQASVDVLDGLASASLTLTAGVGVKVSPGPAALLLQVPPDPIEFLKETTVTLMAEVAVGIHISVCWLVHIDFDGSWPFSETISGKTLAALV